MPAVLRCGRIAGNTVARIFPSGTDKADRRARKVNSDGGVSAWSC
jgi:hypothetical protein